MKSKQKENKKKRKWNWKEENNKDGKFAGPLAQGVEDHRDLVPLLSGDFSHLLGRQGGVPKISSLHYPCTILALSHLVLVPLFSIQKIIKKSTSQKIIFFGIFRDFLRFVDAFFTILGLFWVPQGVIFRLFWQVKLSVDLFTNFLKKNKNSKNENVAFVS